MNITITGGGTGGHLSIARALGYECKKRGITTPYIGSTKGQDRQWFDNADSPFQHLVFLESTTVVNQSFFGKWSALAQNITESSKARRLLRAHNIESCISVGGFSAAVASFAAVSNGIPFFIHEQNACIGSLNKILKPFAKKFFSSFEFAGATITPYPVNEVFFTTQRIRERVEVIAFFGGSQGARAINTLALQLAPLLRQRGIRIVHQAGKLEYENTYQSYKTQGLRVADSMQDFKNGSADVFVFDFSAQMVELIGMADFCVSRSGASSLWEIASNGLPALFIPYPYAVKNHQYFNAKNLMDKGLALLYTQEELQHITVESLIEQILDINLSHISESLIHITQSNGIAQIIDCVQHHCSNATR